MHVVLFYVVCESRKLKMNICFYVINKIIQIIYISFLYVNRTTYKSKSTLSKARFLYPDKKKYFYIKMFCPNNIIIDYMNFFRSKILFFDLIK